jgi:ATP-dependent RNA helicase DDX23/PRP28
LDSLVVPLQQRTTFMFSATLDANVVRLAHKYMKPHPIVIRIGDEESGKNKDIDQRVLAFSSEQGKDSALLRLLQEAQGPVICFCNSKQSCDAVVKTIRQRSRVRACALHSGKNQVEREDNLRQFKLGEIQVLVASDVAGRGLDVEGVAHVINYDCPTNLDRYCHRIGRTGRAGKRGLATTFIVKGQDEPEVLLSVMKYMKQTGQEVPRELKDAIGDFRPKDEARIQD